MSTIAFILSKLLWAVLRPSTLLVLLALAGVLIGHRQRSRTGWRLTAIGVGGLTLLLVVPVGQVLLLPLEDRFARPASPPAMVHGIVVLGGAVEPGLTRARGIPALNAAAERMTEFVALARRYPDAQLVFTGGYGSLLQGQMAEAEVARSLFDLLGLAPERVLYEGRSRNTYENALLTRQMVRPEPGQVWLLVTSASHMPRSVGIYRRVGWPVVAWPVGYKSGLDPAIWYDSGLPERLGQLDFAVHEWIGLAAYWLMGRTSALFPAP